MTPSPEAALEIAYLGPEGSFSHLVAQKRYPDANLRPLRTVPEIFEHLEQNERAKGIVPIENSSGGMIVQTVDGVIQHARTLYIQEELSLNVRLALFAQSGTEIRKVYSHFAPLQHCEPYLKERYPNALLVPQPSTSGSAEAAAREPGAAAIGQLAMAERFGLEVIAYPIREEVPNITQFFVVGHQARAAAEGEKTSLVVALPNHAGSLFSFLKPFAEAGVNLTRIESRPTVGQPNTYRFLVEVHGTEKDQAVQDAFRGAQAVSTEFINVGSYPVVPRYQS